MKASTILTLTFAALLAAPGFPQAVSQPDVMFERARQKESLQGDLKGAIEVYRQVLAKYGRDRAVAARAKLRMAECHEKLGQSEARKIYEDVARNYTDQSDAAAQARARLQSLGGASAETTARLVWDQAIDYWGCLSADGRLLSFIDWSTGDLAVRDLRAGQHRRVTDRGGFVKAQGEAEASCISPDGKRIAYNWQSWDPAMVKDRRYELRLINSDGSGERVVRPFGSNKSWVQAHSWSPDSRWIALAVTENDISTIQLVPADGGEARTVPTRSKLTKHSILFSPDGKWLAYHQASHAESDSGDVFVVAADGSSAETMVVPDAQPAGWAPGGSALIVERTEGQDRKLFLQPIAGGKVAGEPAVVFGPAISGRPAFLGVTAKGDLYYGTTNHRIEGWLMQAEGGTTPWSKPLLRFPVGVIGFANNSGNLRFSPDGKELASMAPNNAIQIRTIADGKQRMIAPVLNSYRRFEWAPDGKSFFAAAIGEKKKFGIYRIDGVSGAATYVCPIEAGNTFAPSADGRTIYNFSARNLTAIDLATCRETPLPTRDWSSQGPRSIRLSRDGKALLLASFAYIGIYDIASGSLRELFRRKEEVGTNVWSVDWSADGRSVVAVVRPPHNFLGGGAREIWVFPAQGGQPRVSQVDLTRNVSMSADGTHVAALHYENRNQVWVMENFLAAAK